MTDAKTEPVSGPVLFARYAFAPNHHGYCGPDDAAGFLADGVARDDQRLRAQARDFDGAWPLLEVVAAANDLTDPLDPGVVAAYWLGGTLVERVRADRVSDVAEAASLHRSGPLFGSLRAALRAGAVPHHGFTVLCTYPWIAMLGDDRRTPQAMIVLDRCRIRWGTVLGHADSSAGGDLVTVESRPLRWDGRRLGLGDAVVEQVRQAIDGVGLPPSLAVGDRVTLHWDWVCDLITEPQQATLAASTQQQLDLVNVWLSARALTGANHG